MRPCRECIAGFAAFVGISLVMLLGITSASDDAVLRWVGTIRSDSLTTLMRAATVLGDGALEIPVAFMLLAIIWQVRGRGSGLRYLYCALSGEVVYVIAKASFQRPRPDIIARLGSAGWHSYPSGHAMLAPIVYGVGFVLLAHAARGVVRRALLALAVAIPLAIAVSRVYLGVHYPSDVLGALALGSAWGYLWFGSDRSSSCATSSAPATT